jgi:tyrocidine synthetase III
MNRQHRISNLTPQQRRLLEIRLSKRTSRSSAPVLEPVEEKEYYPLSPVQQRLYLLNQFMEYSIPLDMQVEGRLEVERLQTVFRQLIGRHESLRTGFEMVGDLPVQRIHAEEEVDFRLHTDDDEIDRSFDLSKPPLLRAVLVRETDTRHRLRINVHHLVMDGVSRGILTREFLALYRGEPLPEQKIRYRDIAEWQNRWRRSKAYMKQEDYWRERFQGEIPVLDLPTDNPRPSVQRFESDKIRYRVEGRSYRSLEQLASQAEASKFQVMQAVLNIQLSRYTHPAREDIVVGTVTSGRRQKEYENVIGVLINPQALRNKPQGTKTVLEFIREVRQNALDAFENQEYPFGDLLEKHVGQKDLSRNPLFDVMQVYRNRDIGEHQIEGLRFTMREPDNQLGNTGNAQQDITQWVVEESDHLRIDLEYATALYRRETMERFIRHFLNILEHAAADPLQKLSEIQLMGPQEKHRVLETFNTSEHDGPVPENTLHRLFEEQAEQTPERAAITGPSIYREIEGRQGTDSIVTSIVTVTYGQLNRRADRLAGILKNRGVQPDIIVGLKLPRSVEMLIGILGILKAGGAYLPIDPEAPDDRIDYMLEDSNARLLISNKRNKRYTPEVLYFEHLDFEGAPDLSSSSLYDSLCSSLCSSLCYIIYTSGTTGRPKGVMTEHRSVVSYLEAFQREFNIGSHHRVLQQASNTFDIFVEEVYPVLLRGGQVFIPHPAQLMDPGELGNILRKHRINILDTTPQMLNEINRRDDLESMGLDIVISGGDKLEARNVDKLVSAANRLYNTYGPTETTVCAAYHRYAGEKCGPTGGIPIGKPIANYTIYILDQNHRPQPIGIPGEITISGPGLARGYQNRPELTHQRFTTLKSCHLTHLSQLSHRSHRSDRANRAYSTGDQGRWNPDGTIQFLGRLDTQVKIRGYRIELGEIEKRIREIDGIEDAVVAAADGHQDLCAYIVPKIAGSVDTATLMEKLSTHLPAYMVPGIVMEIRQIPLTGTGKVDRRALPEPGRGQTHTYEPPQNHLEHTLADIWADVLDRERVGVRDNFFHRGGNSLRAMALVSKIRKELDLHLDITEIFSFPTIRGMAEAIGGESNKKTEPAYEPLEPVEKKEYYPLSSAQKRQYILNAIGGIGTAYHITRAVEIEGALDRRRLETVFRELTKRHESMRTEFHRVKDEPVQRVRDDVDIEIETYAVVGNDEVETEEVEAIIRQFVRPFKLERAPLFRVGLIEVRRDRHISRHILILDQHHIVSDGISMGIIIKEFSRLYGGEMQPAQRIQYRDYSEMQQRETAGEKYRAQETYWKNQFQREPEPLQLPLDKPRPQVQDFRGAEIGFSITRQQTQTLKRLALKRGATLYQLLIALTNLQMAKLTGSEDITIGIPVSGRTHPDLENIVGMFVNTLPLRNKQQGSMTVEAFLDRVKNNTVDALANQDYPYEDIVERVVMNRDAGRNPLFDVVLVYRDFNTAEEGIDGLTVRPLEREEKNAKFDLVQEINETSGTLHIKYQYAAALFNEETIRRFAGYKQQLIASVIANPASPISEIEILSKDEKRKIINQFNRGPHYNNQKTQPQLFREQVSRTPYRIALHASLNSPGEGTRFIASTPGHRHDTGITGSHITYKELDRRSDAVARHLINRGICPNDRVAIKIEKSIEMHIGIQGIWKAGAAYVPIAPDAPENRVEYMLRDSNAGILLTLQELKEIAEEKTKTVITTPSPIPSPDTQCYIIYTSGSTGRPKGVPITHGNLSPLLHWGYRHLDIGPGDRVVQNLPYHFDWSVWEYAVTLTTGAALYAAPPSITLNPLLYEEYLSMQGITVLHITPTQWQYQLNLERKQRTLRCLFIGAEKLTWDVVRRSREKVRDDCRIFNMYGPTEATIITAVQEITNHEAAQSVHEHNSSVPIGPPVANTSFYILDKYRKPVPIGVPGELYIAGDGLSGGYQNQPELTHRHFKSIELPQLSETNGPSGNAYRSCRAYRTGDRVRWLKNGTVEFLGRIDHQVKIRGYRIELGEIENRLLSHPRVREAIVIERSDSTGETYLAAYIVPAASGSFEAAELREYLSRSLPAYMIPARYMELERLPLNPNGKVDRDALPEPAGPTRQSMRIPRTEMERRLASIWSEVLGPTAPKTIGIDRDFFEIGGHSLKATVMAAKIHKETDVEMTLEQVFTRPTIREQAAFIEGAVKEIYAPIEPVEQKEYYPQSSAQKRLYILYRMESQSIAYNMPTVVRLPGNPDREGLEKAIKILIERHESYRTGFCMIDDEPVQRVYPEVDFRLEETMAGTETEIDDIIKAGVKPFDLSRPPLLRALLVRCRGSRTVLMVDVHHIISDGTSQKIQVKEFTDLYYSKKEEKRKPPEPLRIQYKDYAQWQQRNIGNDNPAVKAAQNYWHRQFEGEIPVLELPTDYPRPPIQRYDGDSVAFALTAQETGQIKEMARQKGVTNFMYMQAVITVLLSKLCGMEDIVMGVDTAGRKHSDIQPVVGMFVNTLPMRHYPAGDKHFDSYLEEIRQRTLQSFRYQDYPFENLVEQLAVTRDTGRNPLFDVMFSYLDLEPKTSGPGSDVEPYPFENKTAKFDQTINVHETPERFEISIEYAVALFRESTIRRYAGYIRRIIAAVIENSNRTIASIGIITKEEKRRILEEYNRTKRPVEREKGYAELFEEQVQKTPHRVAVVHNDRQITYRRLNRESEEIARRLRRAGLTTGNWMAALYLRRGITMVAAVIGVYKAGGAYVPVETDNPAARVRFILQDSEAPVVITEEPYSDIISGIKKKIRAEIGTELRKNENGLEVPAVIILNGDKPAATSPISETKSEIHPEINLETFPETRLENRCTVKTGPNDPVYMIYTSGTTGKPKGVVIHQLGMINHLYAKINDFNIDGNDIIAQTASISFDISVWQNQAALLLGGVTAVIDKETILDGREFLRHLRQRQVTIVETVPSLMTAFLETAEVEKDNRLQQLRLMVPTGEALTAPLARRWYRHYPSIPLINAYGPTEASDDVTHYTVPSHLPEHQTSIPVGKPLQNLHIYIVDRHGALCPDGVRGEICVAGIGVGPGYWKDIQKTRRAFQPNPYIEDIGDPDYAVMYRTGDIGYYQSDGNIQCLGRLDHQVKIRGNRIELGEIERRLMTHPNVGEAVVIDYKTDTGDKILASYVVTRATRRNGTTLENRLQELREHLSAELPDYMIPAVFTEMDKLPLTTAGKIDRKRLPRPVHREETHYNPPRDNLEKKLAIIWQEVQGRPDDKMSRNADFFRHGGDSLKAVRLVNAIHKEMSVRLPVQDVFREPTIAGLADIIRQQKKNRGETVFDEIPQLPKQEYYELSYAQKRLWVLHKRNPGSAAFNMPERITLFEAVDVEKIRVIQMELLKRHEALRTGFHEIDGRVVQRIAAPDEFKAEIQIVDLSSYPPEQRQQEIIRYNEQESREPFDISRPPLMRVKLLKIRNDRYEILFTVHHLVSDGWSMEQLRREFTGHYRALNDGAAYDPEPVNVRYRDYAHWHNRLLENPGKTGAVLEYWRERLTAPPQLELPYDVSPEATEAGPVHSAGYRTLIDAGTTESVRTVAGSANASIFQVLLAALNVTLARITGKEEIMFGLPGAARSHEDTRNTVGLFVNTQIVRSLIYKTGTFREHLLQVRDDQLKMLDHQDYPLELVCEKLDLKYPDISLFFNMEIAAPDVASHPLPPTLKAGHQDKVQDAKFHLVFYLEEYNNGIDIAVHYHRHLFLPQTIEKLLHKYTSTLHQLITSPDTPMNNQTAAKKKRILKRKR